MKKLKLCASKEEVVHLFSAQSYEVFKIAINTVYYAKSELSREPWNYDREREMLNGLNPIWGFIPSSWNIEDYYDGEILELFRCEMSLQQRNSWDNLILLELNIPRVYVKRGVTHNASSNVVVFPYIVSSNIIAAYKLTDSIRPDCLEGLVGKSYFKVVEPFYINKNNIQPWVNERMDFAKKYMELQ